MLAVYFFGDILSASVETPMSITSPVAVLTHSGRITGIFLIISGSVLYVYSKSSAQTAPAAHKLADEKNRSASEPFLSGRALADLEKGDR